MPWWKRWSSGRWRAIWTRRFDSYSGVLSSLNQRIRSYSFSMNPENTGATAPSKLTFIVPVFNRPGELRELLESMAHQSDRRFELVVVEDGSTIPSKSVVSEFAEKIDITYLEKVNTGPGPSRNYGCTHSSGEFFVFVDSDCVLPTHYVAEVLNNLERAPADAFGGPDSASSDFTSLQKAINHSMTSFLTTGGIRGGSERITKFMPRSFNMGMSRTVFDRTGGFPEVRFAPAKAAGEDLDLSYSMFEMGFNVRRIPTAFVWHKRRTNWTQFVRQVYNFGFARITVAKRHPGALKLLHAAPALYTIGLIAIGFLSVFHSPFWLVPFGLHAGALGIEASFKTRSLWIGFLSVFAGLIQLVGYGSGFLHAAFAPSSYVAEKP
jgi:GT2 family glycosyltransferase